MTGSLLIKQYIWVLNQKSWKKKHQIMNFMVWFGTIIFFPSILGVVFPLFLVQHPYFMVHVNSGFGSCETSRFGQYDSSTQKSLSRATPSVPWSLWWFRCLKLTWQAGKSSSVPTKTQLSNFLGTPGEDYFKGNPKSLNFYFLVIWWGKSFAIEKCIFKRSIFHFPASHVSLPGGNKNSKIYGIPFLKLTAKASDNR